MIREEAKKWFVKGFDYAVDDDPNKKSNTREAFIALWDKQERKSCWSCIHEPICEIANFLIKIDKKFNRDLIERNEYIDLVACFCKYHKSEK